MEKKTYHIYNRNLINEDNYLKLTDSEVNFLIWLNDMGYLDEDTIYEDIEKMPTPIEF